MMSEFELATQWSEAQHATAGLWRPPSLKYKDTVTRMYNTAHCIYNIDDANWPWTFETLTCLVLSFFAFMWRTEVLQFIVWKPTSLYSHPLEEASSVGWGADDANFPCEIGSAT